MDFEPGSSLMIILCLLLLQHVKQGYGISCYTCSSVNWTDINCHDPFHPAMSTYTEECRVAKEGHIGQFPANFCIKVIGTTVQTQEEHVIRACTLENMDNQCGVFKFEQDTLQGCILTCDYDGCNTASLHHFSVLTFSSCTVILGSLTLLINLMS